MSEQHVFSNADTPLPEIKTPVIDIGEAAQIDFMDDTIPVLNPDKTSGLLKNEDPADVKPFVGARYEVIQFNLWEDGQVLAYQEKLTEVGTDPNSYITFHDRISDKEHGSWSVLLEIAHRVRVKR